MPSPLSPAQRAALTANDRRVLSAVEIASRDFDGFAPHGVSDWIAVKRLTRAGLVEPTDPGVCQSCREPHDTQIYVLTAAGREALGDST